VAQDPRREWLEEAMNRWEKPILRLCYAYLGDRALAEDAV
jgi:DNA-directed RNA polymerase specialized sigma24 family protein